MTQDAYLSVISLKCAPDVFDLSTSLRHVSLRDQAVRSEMLATNLNSIPDKFKSAIVVGAGVAGVSFALTAVSKGWNILLIEKSSGVCSMISACNERFISPSIYEWPLSPDDVINTSFGTFKAHTLQGLLWKNKVPVKASIIGKDIQAHFLAFKVPAGGKLLCNFNAQEADVKGMISKFMSGARTHKSAQYKYKENGVERQISINHYQYLVLSTGIGSENTEIDSSTINSPKLKFKKFWDDASVLEMKKAKKVLVSGAGDGAVQDVLIALTGCDHPVDILNKFGKKSKKLIEPLLLELMSWEYQNRMAEAWGDTNFISELQTRVDCVCSNLHNNGLTFPVNKFKSVNVIHLIKEVKFGLGKLYMLNRFVFTLLTQQAIKLKIYEPYYDIKSINAFEQASKGTFTFHWTHGTLNNLAQNIDGVSIRHGVSKDINVMIAMNNSKEASRTVHSKIQLPWSI